MKSSIATLNAEKNRLTCAIQQVEEDRRLLPQTQEIKELIRLLQPDLQEFSQHSDGKVIVKIDTRENGIVQRGTIKKYLVLTKSGRLFSEVSSWEPYSDYHPESLAEVIRSYELAIREAILQYEFDPIKNALMILRKEQSELPQKRAELQSQVKILREKLRLLQETKP